MKKTLFWFFVDFRKKYKAIALVFFRFLIHFPSISDSFGNYLPGRKFNKDSEYQVYFAKIRPEMHFWDLFINIFFLFRFLSIFAINYPFLLTKKHNTFNYLFYNLFIWKIIVNECINNKMNKNKKNPCILAFIWIFSELFLFFWKKFEISFFDPFSSKYGGFWRDFRRFSVLHDDLHLETKRFREKKFLSGFWSIFEKSIRLSVFSIFDQFLKYRRFFWKLAPW